MTRRIAFVGATITTVLAIVATAGAGVLSVKTSEDSRNDGHSRTATCSRLVGVGNQHTVIVVAGPCPDARAVRPTS